MFLVRLMFYDVPQGSVLDRFLFLISVNDLSFSVSDHQVIHYTDDTHFVHTGTTEDVHDLVKKSDTTLTKVRYHFHFNGLMLNTAKTQRILIDTIISQFLMPLVLLLAAPSLSQALSIRISAYILTKACNLIHTHSPSLHKKEH